MLDFFLALCSHTLNRTATRTSGCVDGFSWEEHITKTPRAFVFCVARGNFKSFGGDLTYMRFRKQICFTSSTLK